jgi:hypothetical protein
MAQANGKRLFERVLPGGNAGSIPGIWPQPCAFTRVWWFMTTHSSLRPMDAFNPAEPAVLHDLVSDTIVTWTADQAEDYRR